MCTAHPCGRERGRCVNDQRHSQAEALIYTPAWNAPCRRQAAASARTNPSAPARDAGRVAAAGGHHREADVLGRALVQLHLGVALHRAHLQAWFGDHSSKPRSPRSSSRGDISQVCGTHSGRKRRACPQHMCGRPGRLPIHRLPRTFCGSCWLSNCCSPSWPWKPRPMAYMQYSGAGESGRQNRPTVWYVPSAMAVPCAAALDCPVTKLSSVTYDSPLLQAERWGSSK